MIIANSNDLLVAFSVAAQPKKPLTEHTLFRHYVNYRVGSIDYHPPQPVQDSSWHNKVGKTVNPFHLLDFLSINSFLDFQ